MVSWLLVLLLPLPSTYPVSAWPCKYAGIPPRVTATGVALPTVIVSGSVANPKRFPAQADVVCDPGTQFALCAVSYVAIDTLYVPLAESVDNIEIVQTSPLLPLVHGDGDAVTFT